LRAGDTASGFFLKLKKQHRAQPFAPGGFLRLGLPAREVTLSNPQTLDGDERLMMSRGEVCLTLGLSYPTIWQMMREGKFPCPLKIAKNRVGWLRSEVLAYIRNLPRQTYKT
jgi:predicted DNA-binding transcriptional regulator AlpA